MVVAPEYGLTHSAGNPAEDLEFRVLHQAQQHLHAGEVISDDFQVSDIPIQIIYSS